MRVKQLSEQCCRNNTHRYVLNRVVSLLEQLLSYCDPGALGREPGKELVHPKADKWWLIA